MKSELNEIKKRWLPLVLAVICTSCSAKSSLPTKIHAVRPKIENTKVISQEIPRLKYKEAVADQSGQRRLRIVPIMSPGGQSSPAPEYRLFGVQPNSAAHLLGLRDADVLVAANEFILYEPNKFKSYLVLLQNESSASIEIRRGGDEILFEYKFN